MKDEEARDWLRAKCDQLQAEIDRANAEEKDHRSRASDARQRWDALICKLRSLQGYGQAMGWIPGPWDSPSQVSQAKPDATSEVLHIEPDEETGPYEEGR